MFSLCSVSRAKSQCLPKEEDRSNPIELVAVQSCALDNASYRSIRKGCLVDVLQEVHNADQRHDVEINFPQETLACFGVDRSTKTSRLFEKM